MTTMNASKPVVDWEEMSVVGLNLTEVVDFGTPMMDILSGEVAPPPQGARINVDFSGATTGALSGTMSGTDFMNIRADGRIDLNIHAVIVTPDGARIAYEAGGVSVPGEGGIGHITETAKLTTSSEKYAWVNGHTFVAKGTVNLESGEVALVLSK
ncbi:MAG: DUF3237 family protein [Burkholderiaceae bacterium]